MASDSQSEYEKDIVELKKLLTDLLEKNPDIKPLTDEEKEELVDIFKKYLNRVSGPVSLS